MPTIVSNPTPLIHPARIGQLGLLRDFFGNVMIPPAVYDECVVQGKAYRDALLIAQADWLEIKAVSDRNLVILLNKEIVLGDTEGLRILLVNLVENAVRYTPMGGQGDVRVSCTEDGGPVIEVSETGPGILAKDQTRVFDRFYRGEATTEPGTGLGLAIVKTVSDRHGAKIELSHAEPHGLRVRVFFPSQL